MDRSVGVVILTWNSEKYISECLHSLMAICSITETIVVVDNGSHDTTVQKIREAFASSPNAAAHKLIALKENLGKTVSRNMGFRYLLEGKCGPSISAFWIPIPW